MQRLPHIPVDQHIKITERNCKIPAGFRSRPMIENLTAQCHRAIIFKRYKRIFKNSYLYHSQCYSKRATNFLSHFRFMLTIIFSFNIFIIVITI